MDSEKPSDASHEWGRPNVIASVASSKFCVKSSQVRLWVGWYRHITLAMLAHAFLAVTRSYAAGGDGKRGICSRENSSH